MKKIIVTVASIIILMNTSISIAENGWELSIKAKVLNAENILIIGQNPDASDGVDGRYDVPALLAGDIEAYIKLGNDTYWKDIKESCTISCQKSWNFFVDSKVAGQIIELRWNPLTIPENISINLTDKATNNVIDMKKANNYYYENTNKREFIVNAQIIK